MDSAAEGEGDGEEEEEERGKVCSEDDLVVARCVSPVRWTHRITLSTGGGRGEGGW